MQSPTWQKRRLGRTDFSRPSRVDEDVAACMEPIGEEVWQELHEEFGL